MTNMDCSFCMYWLCYKKNFTSLSSLFLLYYELR